MAVRERSASLPLPLIPPPLPGVAVDVDAGSSGFCRGDLGLGSDLGDGGDALLRVSASGHGELEEVAGATASDAEGGEEERLARGGDAGGAVVGIKFRRVAVKLVGKCDLPAIAPFPTPPPTPTP